MAENKGLRLPQILIFIPAVSYLTGNSLSATGGQRGTTTWDKKYASYPSSFVLNKRSWTEKNDLLTFMPLHEGHLTANLVRHKS